MRRRVIGLCLLATAALPIGAARAWEHDGSSDPAVDVTFLVDAGPGRAGTTTATEASPAASAGSQVLSVAVRPGALSVQPDMLSIDVPSMRTHHRSVIELPPITVVDARGDLAGWTLYVTGDAGRRSERVRVEPTPPTVVDGLDVGLSAGAGGSTERDGRPVELCRAAALGGGGTYRCGGSIVVSSGHSPRTVTLRFFVR